MAKSKIKIHKAEMSEELQQDAFQIAFLALNLYEDKWDIARYIAKEFEKRQGGNWNCILGDYATYVRWNTDHYIRFSFGDEMISVFKSPTK